MSDNAQDPNNVGISLDEFIEDFDETGAEQATEVEADEHPTLDVDEEASETESTGDDDESTEGEDESEADDDQDESEEESETDDEEPEDDDGTLTYKYDGEEYELSAKEVHELRKDAGRSKRLTQLEQAHAEKEKNLQAEVEAVRWAKQKPEVKALSKQIAETEASIQRGLVFNADGTARKATDDEMQEALDFVAEKKAELTQMATPPGIEELRKDVPDLFSTDPQVVNAAAQPISEVLHEFGYSRPEIEAHNEPREVRIINELIRLRKLESEVKAEKAKRTRKDDIVKRPVKSKSSNPALSKPKTKSKTDADILDAINRGEASHADLFMDLD